MRRLPRHLGAAFALCLLVFSSNAATRFKTFGSLAGQHYSEPTDISSDGRFIVGTAENRSAQSQAVRREWRKARLIELGTLAGSVSEAWGISADGSNVVGTALNAAGARRAVRWTPAGGIKDLSLNQDWESMARGVSGNGAVVVGWLKLTNEFDRPFRWTATEGTTELETLGGEGGYAYAANWDGRIIVGSALDTDHIFRACRWVEGDGAQALGDFGGGYSEAYSVTGDGSVIVGAAGTTETNYQAFRWTAAVGLQSLHTNVTFINSSATDISNDGLRITANVITESLEDHAAIWTPDGGLQDMNVVYSRAVPKNWTFVTAAAISADGRWIVGTCLNPRGVLKGYILDTGAPRR